MIHIATLHYTFLTNLSVFRLKNYNLDIKKKQTYFPYKRDTIMATELDTILISLI